jgi:hypothetical protein
MAETGHPILGDPLYATGAARDFPRLMLHAESLRLRDIDVHDLMCAVGKVGQMGNVRRGAEISLSDLASGRMAEAKIKATMGKNNKAGSKMCSAMSAASASRRAGSKNTATRRTAGLSA